MQRQIIFEKMWALDFSSIVTSNFYPIEESISSDLPMKFFLFFFYINETKMYIRVTNKEILQQLDPNKFSQ